LKAREIGAPPREQAGFGKWGCQDERDPFSRDTMIKFAKKGVVGGVTEDGITKVFLHTSSKTIL